MSTAEHGRAGAGGPASPREQPPPAAGRPGPPSLKYAVVERERRFLLAELPEGVVCTREIVDRYVTGTRLRLREVREADGTVTRKLGQKVRLGSGPAEVACTNLYLDDAEWALLSALPGRLLRKRRHLVHRDGLVVAVDEHADGTLVAEIDDGERPSQHVPAWLDVVADVSHDEAWTGAGRILELPNEVQVRRRADVTEAELVGGVEKRELFLAEYESAWAREYHAHEPQVRAAVGGTAADVQHIGSTSVPGLAAKPIIDILVTVPDITAEEDYLGPLIASGYVLRVREPGHRMVRTEQRDVHIHILEVGDPAASDYLLLRDHLRVDQADRRLYEATKRELTRRDWPDMNAYADAKTAVIEEIKKRARARLATDHS